MTKSNVKTIGDICEDTFVKYLEHTGLYSSVEKSSNEYDMQKDVVAVDKEDGTRSLYELKARTVIRKYHAMPLGKDQWYKVDTCDKLIFSNIPANLDEKITFYEVVDKDNDYTLVDSFGPRKVPTRMYDLSKMKKLFTVDDPVYIEKMYSLSISSYKQ
jgi:hypothetical protein